MTDQRGAAALGRIDAALRRVEAAAARTARVPLDDALQARHDRLRHEVGAALAELDGLIQRG